jgi:hypothetical protein
MTTRAAATKVVGTAASKVAAAMSGHIMGVAGDPPSPHPQSPEVLRRRRAGGALGTKAPKHQRA